MKKITAAAMLSIILVTAALLIFAPNKTAEKTIVYDSMNNKTALQVSPSVPTSSPTANLSQTQQPTSIEGLQKIQLSHNEKALPLPSPFVVAVFIIGSVAVFGLILSLCLRKRNKSKNSESSHATRIATSHRKLED